MRSVVGIAISENEREAAIGDRKSDGLDFDRVWVAAVQAPSQFHLPAFDKHLVEGFGHRVNRTGGNISVAFRAMGRANLEGFPQRSEERRVGNGCCLTCRSGLSPYR